MFGLVKGCHLRGETRRDWIAHVCGLCLTLRAEHGQLSRISTNYDAALISVLYEAQCQAPAERTTQVCPLRGFQRAEVLRADQSGAQYAASVALTMAATRVGDHVDDGETWLRFVPRLARGLASRWLRRARAAASRLGFDTQLIERETARQGALERAQRRDFLFYAEPTELAVASAFRHTAVLAGRPENAESLGLIGRMYGRIMYLLDAYVDYADDQSRQSFNALAGYAEAELRDQSRRIFVEAFQTLRERFGQLALPRPELASALLVSGLSQRGRQVLGYMPPQPGGPVNVGEQIPLPPGQRRRRQPNNQDHCCDSCYCDAGCCDCGDCCHGTRLCGRGGNCCGGCDCNTCNCHACDCGGCDCNCCDGCDCCGGCDCNC